MTSSLRKEIEEIIKEKNPLYSQLVDITIVEVEKRIDKLLDVPDSNLLPASEELRAHLRGYILALKQVKEMLSK